MEREDCELLRTAGPKGMIVVTTHRRGMTDPVGVEACHRLMAMADLGIVEALRSTGSTRSRAQDARCEFQLTDCGRLVMAIDAGAS